MEETFDSIGLIKMADMTFRRLHQGAAGRGLAVKVASFADHIHPHRTDGPSSGLTPGPQGIYSLGSNLVLRTMQYIDNMEIRGKRLLLQWT